MSSQSSSGEEEVIFAVLDFKATCDEPVQLETQEIIEVSAVFLNVSQGKVVNQLEFHSYCKPLVNPTLSKFCTELTGISQDKVDEAPSLFVAMMMLKDFWAEHGLEEDDFAWVCCGDENLGELLPGVYSILHSHVDPSFRQWIDLKTIFQKVYKLEEKPSLTQMMERVEEVEGVKEEKRCSSAQDVTKSLTKLVSHLVEGHLPVH
eukprot:TRINITY_DN9426_c0_g1_i1.p1 TRINITY_DN9426_c0_g1~~TRINITY_DN9426_c0_g1_i1.p1  ORF type:complete len:205 (-),score=44.29 TRINITY_DN9426_c0_g1_i1:5-619(-)